MPLLLVSAMFLHSGLNAQKKAGFFKRAYINTVSHYNYFFNANEKVKEALKNAEIAHRDNFTDIVTLFPFSEPTSLKANTPQMDEAIKKCNHIITRRQLGRWVDDSWLLIGKADFFKADFFAALEAFEYVANTYKNTPVAYEAEIWIIKSFIMLEKYDEAVAVSDLMLADKSFPKKLKKELFLVSAEGLIKQGKYVEAYDRLKKAMPLLSSRDYKYRRNFVAGQLAMRNNQPEVAIRYFNKVIKANSPYEFNFYARINMVRLYTQPPINDVKKGQSILTRMLKDDKNLDLLDQIYYELGMIELQQGNKKSALDNFRKALSFSKNNKPLQSQIYLLVAELYFEQSNFQFAQKYYDSAVQVLNPESPDYQTISTRHIVLTELITNLVNISYQDSMLRLARDANFRKETLKKIKDEEKKKKEEEENRKNDPFQNQNFNDPFAGVPGQNNVQNKGTDSRFPFYNPQLKSKGEGDFVQLWGNRQLGDFWRIQSIAQTDNNEVTKKNIPTDTSSHTATDSSEFVTKKIPDDVGKEDQKYFATVPFDVKSQEKAESSLGESYFKAGTIYRDKLSEPNKAKELFEQFLNKWKNNSYRENIIYLLIKLYESEGNTSKVASLKELLAKEFPESKFLQLLDNNGKVIGGRNTPEDIVNDLYEQYYQKYNEGDYSNAIAIYDSVKTKYPGNDLEGQFEYVYGLIMVKQKKMKEYYTIMGNLAANYSGTPLGDLADDRVRAYERLMGIDSVGSSQNNQQQNKAYKFKKGTESEEYYFIIKLAPGMDMNIVKISFSDFNRDFRSDMGLQITTSFVGTDTRALIVAGFTKQQEVKKYIEDILANEAFIKKIKSGNDKKNFLFISKENFAILLKEKIWDDYQQYFLKTYL
ncbi:MAG: tetratricopeptide repeat protein [Bacteroidia bacterium]|nr:tetratricopeptide repeat protein [Bacteroidia bacterium]MCZ2129145.1 tetratricopeptide repeat protein [Bacteroidia bacterium]